MKALTTASAHVPIGTHVLSFALHRVLLGLPAALFALLAGTCVRPTTAQARCPADCDGGGSVGVSEIVTCVNLALNRSFPTKCAACDGDDDGVVVINDLIAGVNALLAGCASSSPTPSETPVLATATPWPPTKRPEATPTRTASPADTVPPTASRTATVAAGETRTIVTTSPSAAVTASATLSHTATIPASPTETASATATPTVSHSPLQTATRTETATRTATATTMPTATASPDPTSDTFSCRATELPASTAFPITDATTGAGNDAVEAPCGFFGGGSEAPDVAYEYIVPADGDYDVTVRSADIAPLVQLRRGNCRSSALLGCRSDGEAGDAVDGEVRFDQIELAAGERLSIVVDSDAPASGSFTLDIHRRRPDLVVTALSSDSLAPRAGDEVGVSVRVENRGDAAATSFMLELQLARDSDATEIVSRLPTSEVVAEGLLVGQVIDLEMRLQLPLIAPGEYHLVVNVIPDPGVADSDLTNNREVLRIPMLVAPGAVLEERLFRADDGTLYQLIRARPVQQPTEARAFALTMIGLSPGVLSICAVTGGGTGTPLIASVAGAFVPAPFESRRSERLRPDDFSDPLFESDTGGRLLIGAGTGGLEVCGRAERCASEPLMPVNSPTDTLPRGCVAPVSSIPGCSVRADSSALAFTSDSECHGQPARLLATVCGNSAAAGGIELRSGEAMVFVHDAGRQGLEVGFAAFGLAEAAGSLAGCSENQTVNAVAQRESVAYAELLSLRAFQPVTVVSVKWWKSVARRIQHRNQ